jgi:hypothetical protein
MRAMGLIAVAILAAPVGGARADGVGVGDLYRRTEALVQSLLGADRDRGGEVIAPPGNIDPKMAFEPPVVAGRMRIIRPPERPEQRR